MASEAATAGGDQWTRQERERLVEVLALYPRGPWGPIIQHVGSKTQQQIAAFVARRLRVLSRPALTVAERAEVASRGSLQTGSSAEEQEPLMAEMEAAILKSALLFVTATCQASEVVGGARLETNDPSSVAMLTELLVSTDALFAGMSLPGDEFEPL